MARLEAAGALSPNLEAVRDSIEEWRRTAKRTRMSEDLWRAAAELARKHGLWATSRAIRIRYDGLKARLGAAPEPSPDATVFCKFGSMASVAGTGGGATTVVELSRVDGARLTMRLTSDAGLDARALIDDRRVLRGGAMIQITPQMEVLVAVAPVDFRRGIDGLAQECRAILRSDPFSGTVFVFCNRSCPPSRIPLAA